MSRKVHAIVSILNLFILFLILPGKAESQLRADFQATPVSGCPPMLINFKDISTGNPTSWKWDFGNGTTDETQNPLATYTDPGTYTVRLVIKNALGVEDSIIKNQYIIVNAPPVGDFTASATSGCFPLKVNFTDRSIAGSGTISAWEWDFGDGAISNEQNPAHTYTLGGSFRVILKVTDSNGCVKVVSKANYITLENGVKADFGYASDGGCGVPAPVSFNNKSTGTGQLSYKWDFGDGKTSEDPNPVNNYENGGVYTVKLIVTNSYGCSDTLIKANAINIGFVKADFTKPDMICAGNAFQLTNTSNPSSFSATSWDFGDGTASAEANPLKVYASAGDYSIKMITDFGSCKDSISKTVTVLPKPAAGFTAANNNGCAAPLNVAFSNTSTDAVSFEWNFGDGSTSALPNPEHTYLSSGSFSVTLIATNTSGCRDTLVQQNFVKIIPPKITFVTNLPVKGCIPLTITPLAALQDSVLADTYFWDFGDGTTSADAAPSHTYTIPGSYNVKLIVTASGCKDSLIIINAVKAGIKPAADFSADMLTVCASQTITFKDQSAGATATEWLWSFGDGSFAINQNPLHQYRDTGFFDVSLVVSNYGCSDTVEKKEYLYVKPPVAKFDTAFLCSNPLKRTFIDRSVGAQSWAWDFGDGSAKNTQKAAHTYADTGSYLVTLSVKNGTCSDTIKTNVVVINEQGKLDVSNALSCINAGINFSVSNIIPTNIRLYNWYFNGITLPAAPAYTNPVTTSYTAAGTWPAAAVITDILSCRDTLYTAAPITIYGSKAAFQSSVAGGCLGDTITFNDSTKTDGIHAVTNWSWNFGDGSIQAFTNGPFSHQYNSQGLFGVSLAVTDSYGCRDSIFKPGIITIADPVAKFTQSDTLICPNTAVTFYNQTSGLRNTYLWQFGDSTTSAEVSPLHTYANEGKYQVSLKVINEYGCSDSITSYINVIKTAAGFLMSDSFVNCPPLTVTFTNTSIGFSKLLWNFDDQAVSDLINPSHIFTAPGTYMVQLIALNNTGCSDTATKKIVVKGPNGAFNYSPLIVCSPGKINFTADVQTAVKYYWNYQEGNTDSTSQTTSSHVYTTPGLYVPRLIVEDSTGCRFVITGKDTIVVNDLQTRILSDKEIVCDSGIVRFSDSTISSGGTLNYKWSFDDGTASAIKMPEHSFTSPGNHTVQLQVTTQGGCTDSTSSVIKVVKSPAASIVADNSACSGDSVVFSAELTSDTSAISIWDWNFGNGKKSSLQHPPAQTYKKAGNYNVALSVTNSSGCIATVTKPINIKPLPSLKVTPAASICAGNAVELSVSGAASYSWLDPQSNLSCIDCANPTANPPNSITYRVKGTSAAGCSSVDSVAVKVLRPYQISVTENPAICSGKSVQLTAQGAPNFKWSPSAGLSNVSIFNPVASPDATATYRVVGYDVNSNLSCLNDTASVTVTVYPNPSVDLGPDKTLATRSTAVLTPVISSDAVNLRWSPATGLSCTDCPKPEFIARNTISYKLRVENEHCYTEDEIKIIVTYDNNGIVIPNAFSPNGDGINDVFYPTGNNASIVKSFTIFNRWGKQIFTVSNVPGNDPVYGWNGTWKGVSAEVGVYYYIAEFAGANNKTIQYTGYVTLLK
jgi:gliding motility-associated-like protein